MSLAYVNNTGYLGVSLAYVNNTYRLSGRLWRMLITQVIWVSLAYVNNTGYLGVSLAYVNNTVYLGVSGVC